MEYLKKLLKYCGIISIYYILSKVLYHNVLKEVPQEYQIPQILFFVVILFSIYYFYYKESKEYHYIKLLGGLCVLVILPYIYDVTWNNIQLWSGVEEYVRLKEMLNPNTRDNPFSFTPGYYFLTVPLNMLLDSNNLYDTVANILSFRVLLILVSLYILGRMEILKAYGINKWYSLFPPVSNYLILSKMSIYEYLKIMYLAFAIGSIVVLFFSTSIPIYVLILLLFLNIYWQYFIYKLVCLDYQVPTYNAVGLVLFPFIYQFKLAYYKCHPELITSGHERSYFRYLLKYFLIVLILPIIFVLDYSRFDNENLNLYVFLFSLPNLVIYFFYVNETAHIHYIKRVFGLMGIYLFFYAWDKLELNIKYWLGEQEIVKTMEQIGSLDYNSYNPLAFEPWNFYIIEPITRIIAQPSLLNTFLIVISSMFLTLTTIFYLVGRARILRLYGINKYWSLIPLISNYLLLDKVRDSDTSRRLYLLGAIVFMVLPFYQEFAAVYALIIVLLVFGVINYLTYASICRDYHVSKLNAIGVILLPWLFQLKIEQERKNQIKI